jgi:hypothetical protein
MNALGSFRDGPVGQLNQFVAAAAHLDGHLLQAGSLKFEAGRLPVARAANVTKLMFGVLLKLLNGVLGRPEHKTILA